MTWPLNCEEPACCHEATLCIAGKGGGTVFFCICHALAIWTFRWKSRERYSSS